MKNFFAPTVGSLVTRGLITLTTGLLLLLTPELTVKTVVMILGGILLLNALLTLLLSFRQKSSAVRSFRVAQGIFNAAVGLVLVLAPEMVVNLFIIVIGIMLLLFGFLQFVGALNAMTMPNKPWFLLVSGLIMILGGSFLLAKPETSTQTIVSILGGIMVLYSLAELYSAWKLSRAPKTYQGNAVEDVTYEEINE